MDNFWYKLFGNKEEVTHEEAEYKFYNYIKNVKEKNISSWFNNTVDKKQLVKSLINWLIVYDKNKLITKLNFEKFVNSIEGGDLFFTHPYKLYEIMKLIDNLLSKVYFFNSFTVNDLYMKPCEYYVKRSLINFADIVYTDSSGNKEIQPIYIVYNQMAIDDEETFSDLFKLIEYFISKIQSCHGEFKKHLNVKIKTNLNII